MKDIYYSGGNIHITNERQKTFAKTSVVRTFIYNAASIIFVCSDCYGTREVIVAEVEQVTRHVRFC